MPNLISVQITVASRAEADKIAHALVGEKLAACVNVVPVVQSVYRYDGKVETADEVMLLAKTKLELFEPLRKLVKALHSYECPCIVATPLTLGHAPYMDWVARETTV